MPSQQRSQWVWQGNDCTCKACALKDRIAHVQYTREREFYAKAKTRLYPKLELKPGLKRLKSAETWEGTHSFYQSWRPASRVVELVQAVMARKGTGFVGDAAAETEAGSDGNGSNTMAAGPDGDCTSRQHLADLAEELEEVDEESLGSEVGSMDYQHEGGYAADRRRLSSDTSGSSESKSALAAASRTEIAAVA